MIEANLVMFRSDGERRDFPLNPKLTCVGRKNDCDIRIPVTEVSRRHAEFTIDGNKISVKDLGSSNGTFVNNKRVKTSSLAAGDHVVIGPVVFTLQINGEPSDLRPVKTKLKRHEAASAVPEKQGASSAVDAAIDDELDPISALEALASSADQTAIDPFDDDDL
ncbi:MAG: FHA domain-containing protein [Planctomycetes bacterium]|nr:FHA domain-containing protein [Planctomycetota bacterium]